jgi:hypothetical protein
VDGGFQRASAVVGDDMAGPAIDWRGAASSRDVHEIELWVVAEEPAIIWYETLQLN